MYCGVSRKTNLGPATSRWVKSKKERKFPNFGDIYRYIEVNCQSGVYISPETHIPPPLFRTTFFPQIHNLKTGVFYRFLKPAQTSFPFSLLSSLFPLFLLSSPFSFPSCPFSIHSYPFPLSPSLLPPFPLSLTTFLFSLPPFPYPLAIFPSLFPLPPSLLPLFPSLFPLFPLLSSFPFSPSPFSFFSLFFPPKPNESSYFAPGKQKIFTPVASLNKSNQIDFRI